MKKIYSAFIFLLLAFSQLAKACDCFFIPTFCETITFGNDGQIWDYLSIHRVKVVSTASDGVNMFFLETYFGENYVGHTEFFQNGSGADCNMFFNNFQVGETYIVAAHRDDISWRVSECGVTFLKVENGVVTGNIAPGVTEVPLPDFTSTANCGDFSPSSTVEPTAISGLIVRPTLASDFVEIKTSIPQPVDMKLTVFDAAGHQVHQLVYPGFNFYSNAKVDMTSWASGVYFLRFEMQGERLTERVVKVK